MAKKKVNSKKFWKGNIDMKKKIAGVTIGFTFIAILGFLMLDSSDNVAQGNKNVKWETNLEEAVKIAEKEKKAVLVNFTGSDWCIWCKRLSGEVFNQKEFENYAKENLVLVMLDFPRGIPQSEAVKKYNQDLAWKYGVRGFPTIVVLDSKGNLIAKTGYQAGGAANFVKHIEGLLKKS